MNRESFSYKDNRKNVLPKILILAFVIFCSAGILMETMRERPSEPAPLAEKEMNYLPAGTEVKKENIIDLPEGTKLESATSDGKFCSYTFRERTSQEAPTIHYVKRTDYNSDYFVIREH